MPIYIEMELRGKLLSTGPTKSNRRGRFTFNVQCFRSTRYPANLHVVAALVAALLEDVAHFILGFVRVREGMNLHLVASLANDHRGLVRVNHFRSQPLSLHGPLLYDHWRRGGISIDLRANGRGTQS